MAMISLFASMVSKMRAYRAWLIMLGFVLLIFLQVRVGVAAETRHQSEAGEKALIEFSRWQGRFVDGDRARSTEVVQEGLALAKQRAVLMRQLMRENPERALAEALKPAVREKLPEHFREFLEERVSGFGSVGQLFDCGHATMAQAIRLNGRLYLAHSPGSNAGPVWPRRNVPLRGVVLGSEIALSENPLELAEPEEVLKEGPHWRREDHCVGCGKSLDGSPRSVAAKFAGRILPLCRDEHFSLIRLTGAIAGWEGGSSGNAPGPTPGWTLGSKRLLYIITQYSGQGSPPTSRATAEAALVQVSQYFANQSYQQTTLTSVVTDPILVSQPASHYASVGLGQLYNDAVIVARAAGWDADDYDFVFIRHAGGPGGAGVGLVGQMGAWVQTDSWPVLAHELGHNYGLFHANGWRPITSFAPGPGEMVEYGDLFDLMGANQGSFSSYEKSVLHWMPEWAVRRVTNSGVYRIHAFDTPPLASNQLYAITLKRDVRDYWLDYRGEFQSGSLAPFSLNGLQIRWPQWSQSRGGSTLVDATPGTPKQFDDAPLAMGHTLSDPQAGVHITTVNRSAVPGQWLDVAVNFQGPAPNAPPQATLSTSVTNVAVGAQVSFSVSATDPDGDALAYGWESSIDGGSAVLAVSSNSPSLMYSWPTAGRYEVRCKVSDLKGGITIVSLVVNVGSGSGYAISGRVTGSGGISRANVRVFSLSSSVSVGDMGYVTHASYRSAMTDDLGRYVLLNLPSGSQTIRVLPTVEETFVPTNGTGTLNVGSDLADVDFVAVAKPPAIVRGIVRDGSQPVSNAVVYLGGQSTVSAADGSYLFSGVLPGAYDVTVSGNNQFVAPGSPIYVDGSEVTNAALFRVLYPVKGKVPASIGLVYVGNGEPGRTVIALPDFSGGFFGDWVYELRLPRGVWNIEASCSGFTMIPSGFTNPVVVVGSDSPYYALEGVQPVAFTNLSFSAVPGTTYSIRGRVIFGNGPLTGVTVSSSGTTVQTDSLGNYALSRLAVGSYSVTASYPGYTFANVGFINPVSVGPDATNINFVASSTTTNSPMITTQPQSQLVTISSNVTFAVTATGTLPLAYQWFFNGITPIVGATNSVVTITNVQDDDAGLYSVVVSNGSSVTSSNALLTVNHPPVPASPVLERYAFTETKARLADFLGSDSDGDVVSLFSVGPGSAQGGTVVTNSGWVIYTPPPGFTNVDSFPFAVSDGRGGISLGTANVVVTFDNVVPQNFRAEILGNGSVRLIFDGIQSRTYSIEYAEDLESPVWQKLATVNADQHGVFVYTDLLPNGAAQRFYRATWP